MGLDERVLVVPTSVIDGVGKFQGFTKDMSPYFKAMFAPGVASFKARRDVEDDPSFKQIIPYAAFVIPGGIGVKSSEVFTYIRGKAQEEKRLHALRSIGIGGHVAESDAFGTGIIEDREASLGTVDRTILREIQEEVVTVGSFRLHKVGLINDDSTQVGSVHLGIAYVIECKVSARENGIAEPDQMNPTKLRHYLSEFEPWSQHFLTGCLLPVLDPRHE